MKKVLWLFAMLVTCMAANAADGNLYVRGLNGDWDNYSSYQLTETTDNQYVLENVQIVTTGEFVIANDDYSVKYGRWDELGTTISEDNLSLKIGKDGGNITYTVTGAYNIKLDLNDTTNPTVTFEYVGEAEKTITYGLRGQFTTDSWSNFEFTEESENIWTGTITPTIATGSFGGLQMTNGTQSAWYNAAEAVTLTETNTTLTLIEHGGANPTFNLTVGKEYTFTFNIETGELSMAFEGDPIEPGYPTTAAVIGQLNGSSEWDTTGAELTSTDEGVFSGTVTLGEYFRIKLDGIEYGGETDGTVVEDGSPVKYVQTGSNAFKTAIGTYTVTINCEEQTLTLVASEEPELPLPAEAPETLYLRGNINATGWTPSNALAMTKSDDGLTFTVTSDITDGGQGVGYFSFSVANGTEEDDAANDWDTNVNSSDRYGAAAGGESATTDAAMPLTKYAEGVNASTCASFSIAPGSYTFTVSFSDDTPTVTVKEAGDEPQPEYPETAAVIGQLNGSSEWDTTGAELASTDEGVFSGIVTLGEYFRIKLDGIEYGGETDGTVVEEDIPVNYVQTGSNAFKTTAGTYTVTINCKDRTVTLSSDEGPTPPSDDVPEHFYMIGNVNGTAWSTSAPAEMTKDGNAFTLAATIDDAGEGFGYFSFCTATGADWDELNSAGDRFGAASENTPVSLTDNVFEEVLTHYVVNVDNSACQSYVAAAGKYTVTVTFSEGEATMKVESEGGSGIADINADNTARAEYYNMQGVRVASPTSGLYIEVRDGQVRKVLVK